MQQIKQIIENTGFEDELRSRTANADYRKKYISQFDGSYVYYILDKRTQRIVYVGQSGNIVSRYAVHFGKGTGASAFRDWCIENGEDRANYEMIVLDLTNIEELDFDDRLLIERMLQYYHTETIVNKRVPSRLSAYEIERFEYICALIRFDFKPYIEVKVSKMTTKKALSIGVDKA